MSEFQLLDQPEGVHLVEYTFFEQIIGGTVYEVQISYAPNGKVLDKRGFASFWEELSGLQTTDEQKCAEIVKRLKEAFNPRQLKVVLRSGPQNGVGTEVSTFYQGPSPPVMGGIDEYRLTQVKKFSERL